MNPEENIKTSQKIGENGVLAVIRQNQPISIYQLWKKLPYASYSAVHNLILRLQLKGLVEIEKKYVKTITLIKIKEKEEK